MDMRFHLVALCALPRSSSFESSLAGTNFRLRSCNVATTFRVAVYSSWLCISNFFTFPNIWTLHPFEWLPKNLYHAFWWQVTNTYLTLTKSQKLQLDFNTNLCISSAPSRARPPTFPTPTEADPSPMWLSGVSCDPHPRSSPPMKSFPLACAAGRSCLFRTIACYFSPFCISTAVTQYTSIFFIVLLLTPHPPTYALT